MSLEDLPVRGLAGTWQVRVFSEACWVFPDCRKLTRSFLEEAILECEDRPLDVKVPAVQAADPSPLHKVNSDPLDNSSKVMAEIR